MSNLQDDFPSIEVTGGVTFSKEIEYNFMKALSFLRVHSTVLLIVFLIQFTEEIIQFRLYFCLH